MVANNAFMIEEMKEKVTKETEKESKSELLIKQLIKKFKILPDEYKNKFSVFLIYYSQPECLFAYVRKNKSIL